MDNSKQIFADIILPLPLRKNFTYEVPLELYNEDLPGKRAIVQFGKKKFYTGIIRSIHYDKPKDYAVKSILSIEDEDRIVTDVQFRLWEWIAEYYMCAVGEVMNAALPSGLKINSETNILLNSEFKETDSLVQNEKILLDVLLDRKAMNLAEVGKILEGKNILTIVSGMYKKNALFVEERLKHSYKPKKEKYVKINQQYLDEEALNQLYSTLEKKAPVQLKALIQLISLSKAFHKEIIVEVKKSSFPKELSSGIQALIKKGIVNEYEQEVSRIKTNIFRNKNINDLTDPQKEAYISIKKQFAEKDIILLHGVTSSGKTEIYIHLIKEQIDQGKQVLYLLPEIALTAQIINRIQSVFGEDVGIYHSKFNDGERVETYLNSHSVTSKNKPAKVIVGVRSAVFLPFEDIGMVIVDEEHENSFKQYDPAPRYNARDAAIVLAKFHKAKVLLGSATPSLESYENSRIEKYGYVELSKRYKGIQMPVIHLADTHEARRKKLMQSHFTPLLIDYIDKALKNKEQVILFQNRRGYAPFLECKTCGHIPQCKNCNVSLTYHKFTNQLVCHYCGASSKAPSTCNACKTPELKMHGFGTEKIEDDIQAVFPKAKVERMDMDSTRKKNAFQNIISKFEKGAIDILIGTQMVSKGLDFDHVSLVGILNADNMLNFPDFRSYERSFQLMAQVAGRAGRKYKQGSVIIQTSDPANHIVQNVLHNDYKSMFNSQALERRNFKYPPYYRLIKLGIKHKKKETVERASIELALKLRKVLGARVLGPEAPVIDRIQMYYIRNILIKIEKNISPSKVKEKIWATIAEVKSQPYYSSLQLITDVDPL